MSKVNSGRKGLADERSLASEIDERRALRYLVWTTTLAVVAALVWASVFELEEITRGQGKVIPVHREQVIQSLDAGVLAELLVREGDIVEKDQILLRIDDARSGPVYREAREKLLSLSAQAARLRAEAYGLPLSFSDELKDEIALQDREQRAYLARQHALNEQVAALTQSLQAIGREISLTAPMVSKGLLSEVELLRLRRQQGDLKSQLADRKNRYVTDANNELIKVESELAQTRQTVLGREDTFKKSVIRAPMKGVVKNIHVVTIGGVIQAGQSILEIIPDDTSMLVEAFVKPSEIAFLHVGQPVVIKLTAYEFNRFGGLHGTLEHISPDTMQDENKQRKPLANSVDLDEGYYRLLISIANEESKRQGLILKPKPGMTATIEIKTGQKTVLEYLFRPLQSVTQALTER
ncbi:HlyD family efflux transporter periplasmic adaptor subunit [Orrella sp. NBD-18]|uniref:HlyD family efflux transporter periplasmic adaptor subunit n=1 Tax=Sheuella amnicola TaxID=2707330 RepID=A0A6B2R5P0_9BURK|nr:HlyD family efflux transporter periplasmic adaptor subunit [Sheuella amnicola]NDY82685.1 HlyD family efflux transporter periplasmic adaptor subunit [Sheuella amnicola]HBI83106.1 hemolysin secretion protein D [Alcaligenaceae bacterium]